jgi:protein-disulfide isomerase
MRDILQRIIRHPWAFVGLLLSAITLTGLTLFAIQVAGYVRDIKAGKPDPFTVREREASISQLLAATPPGSIDLSRVESTGANPMLGNPAAKIHIVEFLDYQCPFCRQSAPDVRAFMNRHADDVLLIIRDFPLESLHPDAMNAAIAARCVFSQGDANRFWRYHDLLFASQDDLGAATLRANAATVGTDISAFDACVASREPESGIRASIEDGTAAGVRGTPTFFVNGHRIQGALDLENLEEIVSQVKERL